ncbi:hypothetical protein ACIG47_19115 [Promicromonospora sp. NPDC052451]|uniref:hypothetical protein n=1 Tax=Promicromonospora sp. NPDC052451 TaxID=3364407 RepID=UPI0037CC2BE2
MTTTGSTYGAGVTLSGGGVNLAAGTYVVSYSWSGDASGDGTNPNSEVVSAYLVLGGTEVAGSRIRSTTATQGAVENEVSNTMTITTTGGLLQLFNGNRAVTHGTTNLSGYTGSINVQQVAP